MTKADAIRIMEMTPLVIAERTKKKPKSSLGTAIEMGIKALKRECVPKPILYVDKYEGDKFVGIAYSCSVCFAENLVNAKFCCMCGQRLGEVGDEETDMDASNE